MKFSPIVTSMPKGRFRFLGEGRGWGGVPTPKNNFFQFSLFCNARSKNRILGTPKISGVRAPSHAPYRIFSFLHVPGRWMKVPLEIFVSRALLPHPEFALGSWDKAPPSTPTTQSVKEYITDSGLNFYPRITFTAWAYGAQFWKKKFWGVYGPRATKFSELVDLGKSFQKIPTSPPGDPPFLGNLGVKLKFWTQISPPPRGLGGHFRCHTMRLHGDSLSSKIGNGGPLLWFWGSVFLNFWIFFKVKSQTPVAPSKRINSYFYFACRFLVHSTSL